MTSFIRTHTKGFTLIELLIVIAIIAILSGIILVSLGGARNKAADGAVQSALAQFKVEAELYANGNNSNYNELCDAETVFSASKIASLRAEIAKNAKSEKCKGTSTASGGAYAYFAQLKGAPDKVYCIDSTGRAGIYSFPAAGLPDATVCDTGSSGGTVDAPIDLPIDPVDPTE